MTHDSPTLSQHYTLLVYPFRHALTPDRRREVLQGLEGRWLPWRQRLDGQKPLSDQPLFFLPHVRNLLFPELAEDPGAPTSLGALATTPATSLLRLTLPRQRVAEWQNLHVSLTNQEKTGADLFLRLAWVDVALFPQQLG